MRIIRKRNIIRNLNVAFPGLDQAAVDRRVLAIVDNLSRVVAEISHLGAFARGEEGTRIDIEGLEYLIPGVPSIFVGAHLSNWEIAGTGLARHLGGLNTIYSPIGIPEIDKLLVVFRGESGANYLERNLASIKTVYSGMEAGKGVALLIDRRIDGGEPVNFFGRATATTSLPAKLAIRFNAPIVPVDAKRVTARHFIVTLFPPIMAKDFPGPERVGAMTQAVMDAIERSIQRSPDTWFCGQTRWKIPKVKKPAMEPA